MPALIFAWIQRGNGYEQFLAESPDELLDQGLRTLADARKRLLPHRPVQLAVVLPNLAYQVLSGDFTLDPAVGAETLDWHARQWFAQANACYEANHYRGVQDVLDELPF